MYDTNTLEELKRLKFEDFLWIVFGILCFLNVYGDYNDKEDLLTHNKYYKSNSNKIFELTLIITFFIYLYFLSRNYKFYKKASFKDKNDYYIKLLGSSFLLVGVICLIYFQTKQSSFIGSPAL